MLQFERWILLQIVDTAWKDHLHGMDQLRESIGYRSFSQRDPRIEFKREGANLYEEMQMEIRDRVTDLIFKAKLQPQIQQRGRPGEEAKAAPRPAPAPAAQTTRAATAGATAPPAAQGQAASAQQPRQKSPANAAMTLGRNEVVTVLDPKSGKKETMKFKKAKPLLEQGWRLVNK
jgi:preprotein translocase subunit SecA